MNAQTASRPDRRREKYYEFVSRELNNRAREAGLRTINDARLQNEIASRILFAHGAASSFRWNGYAFVRVKEAGND